MVHTGRLQLLSGYTQNLVSRAFNQLQHGADCALISSVNGQQYTLDSLTLVRFGILGLLTAIGGQSEELRQDKKIVVKSLLKTLLRLTYGIGLGFFQALLRLDLVGSRARSVLLIDLAVLSQLFLILCQLCLQSRLLEDLGLLVGIDDLGIDQLVERLIGMLAEQVVGLGSIGLGLY